MVSIQLMLVIVSYFFVRSTYTVNTFTAFKFKPESGFHFKKLWSFKSGSLNSYISRMNHLFMP